MRTGQVRARSQAASSDRRIPIRPDVSRTESGKELSDFLNRQMLVRESVVILQTSHMRKSLKSSSSTIFSLPINELPERQGCNFM